MYMAKKDCSLKVNIITKIKYNDNNNNNFKN